VRLFALEDVTDPAEMIGWVACQLEESHVDFRARLEVAQCVEWEFDFWDIKERCRIKTRMEGVDMVGASVYMIRRVDYDDHKRAKQRRVEAIGTS
jgi:hypothetical protein